jgi:hypothetical protein
LEVLSTGTREAIFLSLRLALIAGYSRRGAKLPIILDDVLVNLDRKRMHAAAQVLRDFALSGHQLLLFTCHEHIREAFEDLAVEVRTLPSREEPIVEPVVPVRPATFALPIVERPLEIAAELEFAPEDPEPAPPRKVLRPALALATAWADEELRLAEEELPTRAAFLDDITVDKEPYEVPEPAPAPPPPRRARKPAAVKAMAPVEELHYDEPGPELKTPRFTWESPERWGRDLREQDAA